jgi:hypothetical protein
MSIKNGIVIGQGYSTIAWLPEGESGWALPIRHERITSWESLITKAAWQLKQVLKHCEQKVLVFLDREYGNGKWVLAVAERKLALLIDIGTPTSAPKSREKSPSRKYGVKCTPRNRYPVARKTYSRPKKKKQEEIVVAT